LGILAGLSLVCVGKADLGVVINGGENIPLEGIVVKDLDVQAQQKPSPLFLLEVGNTFFLNSPQPSSLLVGIAFGVVIQSVPLDHPLDFPGGYFLPVLPLVNYGQLEFAPADVFSA